MSLSAATMANYLVDVTYKPGWAFAVYQGEWEGPHLVIVATLPNAYDGSDDPTTTTMTTLSIHSAIPPMDNLLDFGRWLAWRICRIESHEAREWLKLGGKAMFDPHTDAGAHDVLDESHEVV